MPQPDKVTVPVDTSTSKVISPGTEPQIHCGRTPLQTTNDLVYATPAPEQPLRLDIQRPAAAGLKPLVVYLPGGGFVSADRKQTLNLRTFVAEAGYVVASIDYRVQPSGAVYTDGLADIRAAIRYLRANATTYGIDPARVAVWGESAGGYMAAMTGVTGDCTDLDRGEHLDQSSRVQAVINKFGASDLSKLMSDYGPAAEAGFASAISPISTYITGPTGKSLAASPAEVTAANPVTHAGAGDPPTLILHGDNDLVISPSQTLLLHNALVAAGVNSTRYVIRDAGHGDLAFLGDPNARSPWSTEQVAGIMVDFLGANLS
ncbi:alpha/beta hydrolase [Crossiella cryophila]